MKLYHYTATQCLGSILEQGLSRGEVPLSPIHVLNGVWFTTDSNSAGHGLSDDSIVEPEVRAQIEKINGTSLPDREIRFVNKRAVRITVVVPSSDRHLVHWPKYGRKHLDPRWYDALNQEGGGKHKTWYIYWGVIVPAQFSAVELRQPDGTWMAHAEGFNVENASEF